VRLPEFSAAINRRSLIRGFHRYSARQAAISA
jgi:hypothetical protein